MSTILVPIITTLGLFIMENIIRKQKRDFFFYLKFFTIILGLKLLLWSPLFAQEYRISHEVILDIPEKLTDAQRQKYNKLAKQHKEEGQKQYKLAYEIHKLIPDISDQEKAKQLFLAAMATCSGGKSWSSIVTGLIVLLTEYAINVYEAWKQMEFHLHAAEYNFEMMEFYQMVLEKA